MGLEKDKRIEDFSDGTPEAVEQVIERHKKKRFDSEFRKSKPFLFTLAVITGIIIVVLGYLSNPISRVKAVSVNGNYYLSEEYVKQLTGLNLDSWFYLNFDFRIADRVNKDPMIESVTVSHQANNVIVVNVTEKQPIGYRVVNQAELVCEDGTIVPLTSDYMSILSKVPLITGFTTSEQVHLLGSAFKDVDRSVLEEISEIQQYSLNYDEQTLKTFMRDGNFFFSSYYSFPSINSYNQVASLQTENGVCLFADEGLLVIYKKTCPWDDTPVVLEYWYDDNGEPIYNKYGDQVVKHYYLDDYGNKILDEEGNPIPIPVDGQGNEMPVSPSPSPTAEGESSGETPTPAPQG